MFIRYLNESELLKYYGSRIKLERKNKIEYISLKKALVHVYVCVYEFNI